MRASARPRRRRPLRQARFGGWALSLWVSRESWNEIGRETKAGALVLRLVPAGFVAQVHGADAAALMRDRYVEDRADAQTEDGLVVIECHLDLLRRGRTKHLHGAQHLVGPGGVALFLAPADRI